MITLRRNKVLQNFIGLGTYEGDHQDLAKHWVVGFSVLMLSSLITCTINIYFYFSNVKVVTELMFCCSIYVIIVTSYWTILAHRNEVRGFVIEIQTTVAQSRIEFNRFWCEIETPHHARLYYSLDFFSSAGNALRHDRHYEETEIYLEKITRIYFYLTLCTSILYGFVPVLIVTYDIIMDKYSLKSWSLHYNNVW